MKGLIWRVNYRVWAIPLSFGFGDADLLFGIRVFCIMVMKKRKGYPLKPE